MAALVFAGAEARETTDLGAEVADLPLRADEANDAEAENTDLTTYEILPDIADNEEKADEAVL